MDARCNGLVKWYDPGKGYGFIAAEDGSELFVHRTSLEAGRTWLVDGQEVQFVVGPGQKGPEALHVQVLKDVPLPANRARAWTAGPQRRTIVRAQPLPNGPVTGTIVRIDRAGRYLFVEAAGCDAYVHAALFQSWATPPREGDQVRVTLESGARGPRATSMTPLRALR